MVQDPQEAQDRKIFLRKEYGAFRDLIIAAWMLGASSLLVTLTAGVSSVFIIALAFMGLAFSVLMVSMLFLLRHVYHEKIGSEGLRI